MLIAVGCVYFCYQTKTSIYFKAFSSLVAGILYICVLHFFGYISLGLLKTQIQDLLKARKPLEND
jgi:hypothetical protein